MRRWIFAGVAFTYAAFLFRLSSLSSPPNPTPILVKLYYTLKSSGLGFITYPFWFVYVYPDGFYHTLLYFGFGLVLYSALKYFVRHPSLMTVAVGTVYGASDEIHQLFVPHRTASFWDFMADFFGLMLSQVLVHSARRSS